MIKQLTAVLLGTIVGVILWGSTVFAEEKHKVEAGDTLWGISQQYDTSVSKIKSWNELSSNIIEVGQVLLVNSEAANVNITNNAVTPTSTTEEVVSNNELIKEAKKHIGTPYVWGGTTPSGFDCSGYLKYVFAQEGIDIPRTVSSVYADDRMESVNLSNIQIGDLVFFETYKPGASHMGIYIGSNEFIHSGSSGVTVSSLSNPYWNPRYLDTKRIIN